MIYFTRAWAMGELADEETDRVVNAYNASIDALDHDSAVWRFATSISLNDAWIDRAIWKSNDLSLSLLTGDLQRGYWHTELSYRNARVSQGQDALDNGVKSRPTEIWHDEFSKLNTGMVHRFLLVPPGRMDDRGEVHIEFSAFSFAETRAADRVLPPL